MTTPTTDFGRLLRIENVIREWHDAEDTPEVDAEALAKVRALLSEGESAKVRDETKPAPPFILDRLGSGCMYRTDVRGITIAHTWVLYDRDHGYAPQGAPPEDE